MGHSNGNTNTLSPVKHKKQESLLSASISQFYNQEDNHARKIANQKIEDDVSKNIEIIRSKNFTILNNSLPWKNEDRDEVLVSAIKLRRLNRLSNFHNKLLRDRLFAAQSNVEHCYLSLQNIRSEMAHLKKSIDVCMEFQSSDSDIELMPLQEFQKSLLDSSEIPTITDEHYLHIARLNYELRERKNMLSTLNELDGRRNVLLSDIKGKEQRLLQIKPRISSLIDAANPLLDILALKSVKPTYFITQNKAKFLPMQLSLLFVNARVYNELFTNAMNIYISGEIPSKEHANNMNEEENDDEIESMGNEQREILDEENSFKHRKIENKTLSVDQFISRRLARRRKKLLSVYPLSLTLELPVADSKVALTFSYIPEVCTVGLKCNVTTMDHLNQFKSLFDEKWILDDLITSDIGNKCPNVEGESLMKMLEVNVDEFFISSGKQYKFVQCLCGLGREDSDSFDTSIKTSTPTSEQFKYLAEVISRIKKRISARIYLAQALNDHLLGSSSSIHYWTNKASSPAIFPPKILTKLTSFNVISPEEFLTFPGYSPKHQQLISMLSDSLDSGVQCKARLTRDSFSLDAYINIPISYPNSPALFLLVIQSEQHRYNTEYTKATFELESYINFEVGESLNELFYLQMGCLVSRVDVMLEITSKRLCSEEFLLEHNYAKNCNGKNRGLPFKYNSLTNVYDF